MTTDMHSYPEQGYLTSAEVIRIARISRSTLLRAIKAGKVAPARTPGGHFRFSRDDVSRLLIRDAPPAA